MSQPEKIKKLNEALYTEYDKWGKKQRFTIRYQMLQLHLDIETTKQHIEYHEGAKEWLKTDKAKEINLEIIKDLKSTLKKLLKKANDL